MSGDRRRARRGAVPRCFLKFCTESDSLVTCGLDEEFVSSHKTRGWIERRIAPISIGRDQTGERGSGALLLLFAPGERPDRSLLRASAAGADRLAVASALGPHEGEPIGGEPIGIELVCDGMSYDLVGAAPGPGLAAPHLPHRIGVNAAVDADGFEALALRPGPHLAQGRATVSVVRTMMRVATLIAPHLPRLRALGWPASGVLIGCDLFVSAMSAWVAGGAFPGMGLTAFVPAGGEALRSQGLAFFTGQELHLAPDLANDPAGGTRLGARLIDRLVGQPALTSSEAVAGPDGRRLILEPSTDRKLIRVRSAR